MANVTMGCPEFDADLSALLDGELAPERAEAVRRHVSGCAPCREQLARLARLDAVLANVPLPAVPATLLARLDARIAAAGASDTHVRGAEPARGRAPRRTWRSRAAGAAAAAAAGVALYLAVLSREPSPPAAEPAPPPIARGPEPAAPAAADWTALPDEDLGIALELETVEDLEVIANLELLELLLAAEAG